MENHFDENKAASAAREEKDTTISKTQETDKRNYLRSFVAASAMILTSTGLLSNKASAQEGGSNKKAPTGQGVAVDVSHANKLNSYTDSLTLYIFYRTQMKYLGKEGEVEPFDSNAYDENELEYNHAILEKIAKNRRATEDSLKGEYEKKKITQDEYVQAIEVVDELLGQEKLQHQAVKAVLNDPKNVSRIAGDNIINKNMMPTEQFTDASGHKHPDYSKYNPNHGSEQH